MPIYTKKGDKGETGMISPKESPVRLGKDSLKVNAIGAIDELNSFLGIAKSFTRHPEIEELIKETQLDLFTTASILAGSNLKLSSSKVSKMEKDIDKWEKVLPKVTNFIISGGSQTGTLVFYARALARRAERAVVALSKEEKVKPMLLKYLNRLSDYLWMFSRYINKTDGFAEEVWKTKS